MSTLGSSRSRPADVVAGIVAAPLEAAGFDLEDVSIRRAGSRAVVAIAVDRDGGVDLDAVTDATHVVSESLDGAGQALPPILRSAYTLEVTSRGTDSPLRAPRHWRRAIGRLVEVRGPAGVVTGRVRAADDSGAELECPDGAVWLPYGDIGKAVVQLEFTRRAEPGAELELPDDEEAES